MEQQILSPGSTFADLSKKAWHDLSGKWGWCILAEIIVTAICFGAKIIPVVCIFSDILLFPLSVGKILLYLRVTRNEPISLAALFEPFNQYVRMIWGGIAVGALIILGYLLLIIPGIIFSLRYSMTFYIMLDDPQCKVSEALKESRAIMYGHKLAMFLYGLAWCLAAAAVTVCTLGIGLIWLCPLIATFWANFYLSVKRQDVQPECESAQLNI
ncbi:MAG: DUF975 family protein [Lentisphaeria bacterium]|nr:DUF975 family protein [Lentisphaeria bacterium]